MRYNNKSLLLNIGCGNNFHPDWTNIDFNSTDNSIINHDLLKGIPFEADTFEVVYHSHVLEHFSFKQAFFLIRECFRVLKPGGIIRVVLPDLEAIAKLYIKSLEEVIQDPLNENLQQNYDWITLEMFDQMVRDEPGGKMKNFLMRKDLKNLDLIKSRIGEDFTRTINEQPVLVKKNLSIKKKIKSNIAKNHFYKIYSSYLFRNSGENHKWMYDRYSLNRLLFAANFKNGIQRNAYESAIPNWNTYELDVKRNNKIYAPGSLFFEANK